MPVIRRSPGTAQRSPAPTGEHGRWKARRPVAVAASVPPATSTHAAWALPLPGRLTTTMTGVSATVSAHRLIAAHPPLPSRTAPVVAQTEAGPSARQGRQSEQRPSDRQDPPPPASPAAAQNTPDAGGERTLHHLALRQMISHQAALVVPATASLIRRAPAAPPVGTPRRGTVRIPDSVAETVAAGRTRRPPPVPASVTASPRPPPRQGRQRRQAVSVLRRIPGTTRLGATRTSLLDSVPVSLFERARAGLASPTARPARSHRSRPTPRLPAESSSRRAFPARARSDDSPGSDRPSRQGAP